MKRRSAAVVAATAVGLAWLFVSQRLSNPAVFLLLPEGGAQWIQFDLPVNLVASRSATTTTIFRKRFTITTTPDFGLVTIRAFRRAAVFFDDHLVVADSGDFTRWKIPLKLDLASRLTPGPHELRVVVSNRYGPTALLAYSESLGIVTDENWEASQDAVRWTSAVSVERFRPADLSRRFPSVAESFVVQLPVLAPVFLVVFLVAWFSDRTDGRGWMTRVTPSASQIRWVIIVGWSVLAINNVGKVPPYVGFDVWDHLDYIQYVARTGRVPLATDGWQMFQSPLYYLLSAPLYLFGTRHFEPATVIQILRSIPLLAGLAQVEICYRALRAVYPDRPHLQALGTAVGGLLPMNLYMAQSLGNEPLAGALSASVIAIALGLLRLDQGTRLTQRLIFLGIALGLALLAKVTAVLLLPPLVLLLWYRGSGPDGTVRRRALDIGIVVGIAFVICGWYYLRNWIELGKPFVGGWDQSRNIDWWQDPGYRTVRQFWVFGESLRYPVYSAFNGFWDSVYSSLWMDGTLSSMIDFRARPPWNYDAMISGAWLALVPSIGILTGVVMAVARPRNQRRPADLFAVACLAVLYVAMLALYLSVPIYSTAKASYTLGILPCYALLSARGLGELSRGRVSRAVIYAAVACWAVSSYAAYFVL